MEAPQHIAAASGQSICDEAHTQRHLPIAAALGCDNWFVARVTTCGELDRAIARAETGETGAYIEVVTDKDVAPPLALKIHEARGTLYMQ